MNYSKVVSRMKILATVTVLAIPPMENAPVLLDSSEKTVKNKDSTVPMKLNLAVAKALVIVTLDSVLAIKDIQEKTAKNKNTIVIIKIYPAEDHRKVIVILIKDSVPVKMVISVNLVKIINLIVMSPLSLVEDPNKESVMKPPDFVSVSLDILEKNAVPKNSTVPTKTTPVAAMVLVTTIPDSVPVISDFPMKTVKPQTSIVSIQ